MPVPPPIGVPMCGSIGRPVQVPIGAPMRGAVSMPAVGSSLRTARSIGLDGYDRASNVDVIVFMTDEVSRGSRDEGANRHTEANQRDAPKPRPHGVSFPTHSPRATHGPDSPWILT